MVEPVFFMLGLANNLFLIAILAMLVLFGFRRSPTGSLTGDPPRK